MTHGEMVHMKSYTTLRWVMEKMVSAGACVSTWWWSGSGKPANRPYNARVAARWQTAINIAHSRTPRRLDPTMFFEVLFTAIFIFLVTTFAELITVPFCESAARLCRQTKH